MRIAIFSPSPVFVSTRDRVRAGPAQERPLEVGIVLEAAGGDDHIRGVDLLAALARFKYDARDLAVLHDQLDSAVARLWLDAPV